MNLFLHPKQEPEMYRLPSELPISKAASCTNELTRDRLKSKQALVMRVCEEHWLFGEAEMTHNID